MIHLQNLSKTFRLDGKTKMVLDDVTLTLPGKVSIGLLGRNGAGKSTLLDMIAGTIPPTSGHIASDGSISFRVGFAGSFHQAMTGAQNTRFIARIYGVDTDSLMDYVRDFAELGDQFLLPIRTYSSGMRSRLAFGVSMGLQFDTYLIDEVTAVGDAAFKLKSRAIIADRLQHSGAIFVSHAVAQVRDLCTAGMIIEAGKLTYYDDVEEAIERHTWNQANEDQPRGGRPARQRG